ncbi:MAG: helix-turn-helix domain-containing protein [Anaerolineaceae bacterium]|nr:helix-turn-helix domain-containing protein [Anaerolineaceae bacterium]
MEEIHQLDYQKERLLKPNEVAELLNVSRAMSYHLLQSGQIPVVRINRAVRVKPDDLRSFIEQQRITS